MCIIILQCVQCFPRNKYVCSYGDYNSTIKVFNWPSSHVYFLIPVTITLDNYQTSNAKHNYSMNLGICPDDLPMASLFIM